MEVLLPLHLTLGLPYPGDGVTSTRYLSLVLAPLSTKRSLDGTQPCIAEAYPCSRCTRLLEPQTMNPKRHWKSEGRSPSNVGLATTNLLAAEATVHSCACRAFYIGTQLLHV